MGTMVGEEEGSREKIMARTHVKIGGGLGRQSNLVSRGWESVWKVEKLVDDEDTGINIRNTKEAV